MRFCFYLILLLFSVSCANKTLIRDTEYQPVYSFLQKEDATNALIYFPEKEENGFITTFEKGWLKFWNGEKFSDEDLKAIQKLSDQIEKRKFVSISHEATVFLVGESEDGYIPSEHEIVSLHLFLAMLYLDQKKTDSAHVELKRAIEYLANNPDGKQTTFDDPAIRIWLAALWEAIGDRNASDVDLRKAMELGERNLSKLLDNPKRDVRLLMRGMGPVTDWSDFGDSMVFKFNASSINSPYEFSTDNWYQWHQKRNTQIRDNLIKSRYMTMALGHETSKVSKRTAGLAATTALYAGALAVVVGGVYLALQVQDPQAIEGLFYVTLAGATWFVERGVDVKNFVNKKIDESDHDQAELRKVYRMIRFLPSSIEYIDENLATNKTRSYSGYRKTLGIGHNQVEFIWNPE